jgi:predicted nucleic acid-binding Zn ribbon protein
MRQCQKCNEPIPAERKASAKYCTPQCSKAASRRSSRPCTRGGCEQRIIARGLCPSHYNQEHQPNRHAKKLKPCTNCGKEVLKGAGGGRIYGVVCSDACRTQLMHQNSKLPQDHWALWFGKASPWPRYGWSDCLVCTTKFPPKGLGQKYCSKSCGWKAETIRNGGMSVEQRLAIVRDCARCGDQFNSQHPGRIHCSDLCRDLAATERGARLHHGWIRSTMREAIYERDGHECWLCGEAVDYTADAKRDDWAPSLDHVVPRSKGGTHDASNLRTAHRWCNSVRSDNEQHDLFATA